MTIQDEDRIITQIESLQLELRTHYASLTIEQAIRRVLSYGVRLKPTRLIELMALRGFKAYEVQEANARLLNAQEIELSPDRYVFLSGVRQ